jgi:lipoyl-dependent peroxiredoxin
MPHIEKVIYTAKTYTTGGREGGKSRSSDGRLDVDLTVPGTKGDGTNPEQLLAAGWSSCFLSAVKIVAARLNVSLPGIDQETAQAIVEGAHQTCPYSKAMHSNINVVTRLVLGETITV